LPIADFEEAEIAFSSAFSSNRRLAEDELIAPPFLQIGNRQLAIGNNLDGQ